jgi:hypothetical protein
MRAALGVFAVLLLLAGMATFGRADDGFSGACVRVGLMLGIWWFAYPQVQHVPRWLGFVGGALLLLVMLRPKLILVAIPVLIVLWILRPRTPLRHR